MSLQVYKITNLITGKSYIGKDQTDNACYMGSGLLLWNSYRRRFGRDDLNSTLRTHHKWVFEQNKIHNYYEKTVLCECDDASELCKLEGYYIEKYNTIRPYGYNIAKGGEGGNLIAGYSDEEKEQWRQKISQTVTEAMWRDDIREKFLPAVTNKNDEWIRHISESLTGRKGFPMSDENKEKLRQRNMGNKYGLGNKSRTGYHNSDEMNRRISEGLKKVPHTEEWNKNVSKALKGKPKSEQHKAALRKPKPKYNWLLPDGTIRVMDALNASKHEGWVKLDPIE